MSEFIKAGNKILNKPNGFDYDLINGKVYNLKYERYGVGSYFEEDGSLSLPKKVYTTKDDDIFIKRVNTYFKKRHQSCPLVLCLVVLKVLVKQLWQK